MEIRTGHDYLRMNWELFPQTTHTLPSEDFTRMLFFPFNDGDPIGHRTYPHLKDDTYNIFIWTVIEPCLGVICACLPTLGPLFQGRHTLETLLGSIRSYLGIGSHKNHCKTSINKSRSFDAWKSHTNQPAGTYHEMPDDAIFLTSIYGRQLEDVQSQNSTDEGVYARTNVSTK